MGLLAALMPGRTVLVSDDDTGTVTSAALLTHWRPETMQIGYQQVQAWQLSGLQDYAAT